MSNWVFTTYGGFDSISQALTMMGLIFHNTEYKGLWFGVALFGIIISGLKHYYGALTSGKGGSLSWLAAPLIGIVLMFSLIRTEANLQIIDYTTNQTAGFNVPYGLAIAMSTLNKIEVGMVDVISSAGAVDMPSNYRKFSGGSGYDLFTNVKKHRNVPMEQSLNGYITDCVAFVAGVTQFENFDKRAWLYGDTPSLTGFFDIMSTGQSVLLTTIDFNAQPEAEVSCNALWNFTLYPYYSNPANFTTDTLALCKESGYDPANAGSLAECHSKMAIILEKLTNKTMTAETYIQMQSISQIASTNLNSNDPEAVAVSQASKNLQVQGAGISAVFTKFAPVVRSIMWSLVIMLFPLCALFIATPMFPKIFGFVGGLMVLLVSWTVIDCGIHTAMMYYVSNKFSGLATMGQGTMFYSQMPNAAAEALGFYGIIKGSSLMLATAFAGIFGMQGSHAMTQFAGGIQGTLDGAGRQAGATAFTPEGRAQAIQQQHQASETMSNAHRWTPDQLWKKGDINGQASYGQAQAIKRTNEEAIASGFSKQGAGIADTQADMQFKGNQGTIGGLMAKQNLLKTAQANGTLKNGDGLTQLAENQGGANQALVANGKTTTASIDKNGNVVNSSSNSGHTASVNSNDANRPTMTFGKGSGGAFDLKYNDTLEAQTSKAIDTADAQTATAQTAKAQNLAAGRTQAKSFVDTVQANDSYSASQKKSISDSYCRAFTVSESDVDRLSQSSGLTKHDAHALLSGVQSELGVGTPDIVKTVAGVTAGLKKSGSVTDSASLDRAVTALKSGEYSHMEQDSRDWRSSVTAGKDEVHNKGNSNSKAGAERLEATWAKNDSLTKSVTDAQSHAETVRTTASAMKKQSLSTSEDGFLPTYNQLVENNGGGEKGKAAANKIFADYNNGEGKTQSDARAQILEARDQSGEAFSKDMNKEVARIDAEQKNMSTTVGGSVLQSRKELAQTPEELKSINQANNKEVDAERKKFDVPAGKKIQHVSASIAPTERKAVDAKIPKPVQRNKVEAEYKIKSMGVDLDRKQNQLPLTKELASLQATAGWTNVAQKTEDLSGMAVEGIKETIANPVDKFNEIKDSATEITQQVKGYLKKHK